MGDARSYPTRDFPQMISPAMLVPLTLPPSFNFLSALISLYQSSAGSYGCVGPREAQRDEVVDSKGWQLLLASHPAAPTSGPTLEPSDNAAAVAGFIHYGETLLRQGVSDAVGPLAFLCG